MTSERRAGRAFQPGATGLPPVRTVRWQNWEIVLAVAVAAAAWLAAGALPRLLGVVYKPGRWFLLSLVLDLAFAGVPLALLAFHHRKPLLGTLFPKTRLAQDFGWGLELMLLVGMLNALSVQRAVGGDGAGLSLHPGYYREAFDIADSRGLGFFLLGWGLLPPVAEEIFFRGFLYSVLRRRMRALWAVPVSAAAFALIHPFGEPMLAALVVGLVAATVYEYSGSLLPSIMAHMGLNLSFVLFMAFRGEAARRVPWWVLAAGAAVFALHFFVSSRYLFRKSR